MCCVCDSEELHYSMIYWQPEKWDDAIKRAISEGRFLRKKFRVFKKSFSNNRWGWKIEPVNSQTKHAL